MKREELEKYIGKTVQVTLYDKEVIAGELHKTREEQFKDDPNLYLPDKRYFLINTQSCLFRSSHVIKINEIQSIGNFVYGKHFIYKGKEYCVIGDDVSRNEIECQSVPFDGEYYWFKVVGENKVQLI